MITTPAQIDLWCQAPTEHQRLEFKEAKQQFDSRKLNEYCVAIANEGGGVLILGVADQPPRAVVGTQAFLNTVDAAEKLFKAVGFRVDIEGVPHPDGRVLVLHIPSRPRGTAYNLNGKYLMRAGEALVPMSEDQLRRIFSEGQPDWLEEPSLTGLDAQDVILCIRI
jgi:predicted HTH transcriptional regulator